MTENREQKVFHHALTVVPDLCTGCTHCMTACPTEAIRVRNGLAEIFEERCVDCGACYKACPVSAIIIEQDDFDDIFQYKVRVALLPSVLIGQFPSHIQSKEIFGSLKRLGFTHIFEIDSVVGAVQEGYDEFINNYDGSNPIISTFCPAIVRLIQVRFPAFVKNLIGVKPPSDVAAIHYRKLMEEDGFSPEEVGMFYVTPCAAKIASIKSPVGELVSPVTGVINMEYLYNKMLHLIVNKEIEESSQDNAKLSSKGILWSLTRGESKHQKGRCLAIDGITNVTQFLERLEEAEENNIDFLELRACDESCAGGVLISGNRFLTVERLNSRARRYDKAGILSSVDLKFDRDQYMLGEIPERSMLVLDADIRTALKKMGQIDELLKVLPGIDCAACGSPTCKALAEDIVQGRAELSWCVFLQELYIKNKKMTLDDADNINAGIWGANRNYRSQSK